MGDWKLEVFRLSLYLAFPVTLFHFFNQPALFEEWVTKVNREMYPPEDPSVKQRFQAVANELRAKEERALLESLEKLNKR